MGVKKKRHSGARGACVHSCNLYKKPDYWVTEKRIVDSAAKKPDDWDDEEDGEWEPPMIDNPEFKGEWSVKRISNPAYKGFWEATKIDNPEYEDDNTVYKYADFGFIGFDLWQVHGSFPRFPPLRCLSLIRM